MELSEVLEGVPGLNRRFIYYLEQKRVISPRKIWKRRIARRDYSDEDARIVRETWAYYRRGYAVGAAFELATRTDRAAAFARVCVEPTRFPSALRELSSEPQVLEAAAVHGSVASLMVRLDAPTEHEVYQTLVPFLARHGGGPPQILIAPTGMRTIRAEGGSHRRREAAVIGYVLITVPGKDVNRVIERLKGIAGMTEAGTVYGECDIVAKVIASDQTEFDGIVMDQIHGIPGVESTRTFIVIPSLYWTRSGDASNASPDVEAAAQEVES